MVLREIMITIQRSTLQVAGGSAYVVIFMKGAYLEVRFEYILLIYFSIRCCDWL
jgi:hypothetical protein